MVQEKIIGRRLAVVATTFALSNLLLSTPSHAAPYPGPATKTATGAPVPKPDNKYRGQQTMSEVELLKEKVSLANLPDFTGKAKFVLGSVQQAKLGTNTIMKFHVKEDPKLVIDWYKNTLSMYKWTIKFADAQNILAEQKGSKCAVSVNDLVGMKDGSNTEIEIDYFQRN